MSTSLESIRSAIWRAVFPGGGTITTKALAETLGVNTKEVYRNARALARKRFVQLAPPPAKGSTRNHWAPSLQAIPRPA